MKLIDIFENHNERKVEKWINYFEIYERYLNKYANKKISLLEIGVKDGGSLQLWKKYLGNKSKIVGIDIDHECYFEEEQIVVEIGSQTDLNFLNDVIKRHGKFDIIIDDGSHMQTDILRSFSFLYSNLNDGGVYIIEDLHTAYFKYFEGGITSPFNFVDIASRLVHDVNVSNMKEPYTQTLNDLKGVSFYDSMIIFQKETQPEKYIKIKSNHFNDEIVSFSKVKNSFD